MAVAKSYENMQQISEPFEHDGKMYVKMRGNCPRCGGSGNYSYNPLDGTQCYGCGGSGKRIMEVRWYTDAQRASMDRAAEKRAEMKAAKVEQRRIKFAARNAFGFGEAGYIYLLKGDSNTINEWAHETDPCRARFNLLFGWFCPSSLPVENLPDAVELVRLNWDDVRDETDHENLSIKSDAEVKKIIQRIMGIENKSRYQGTIGSWIERDVTVTNNIALDSRYGVAHMHILNDGANVYVWTTGSKNFEQGRELHLKMKVKEHKEYNEVQQTVVWYCKEV